MKIQFNLAKYAGIIFLLFCGLISHAQTTKTVGASGADYTTLKQAFDAINAGSITGVISLQITDNTTEAAIASLNASGTGSASYTSVTIYPTVSGKTISGSLNSDMITLNGADNVTIDGRVNQTGAKDLVITNAANNAFSTISTIKFINDARNNIIQYCIIKGSNNANTDASGVIFFSTGTTTGNTGNTIDHCDITKDATGGIPKILLWSNGTAAMENTVTVSNNNFYDFSQSGISDMGNGKQWTVSGNSFYQTATVTNTTLSFSVISIRDGGNGHQVYNNYIGGSAPSCGGVAKWVVNSAGTNLSFTGIYIQVGTATATEVYGNTINNLDLTTLNSGATPFTGISVYTGKVNIGTSGANYIGDNNTPGSITVNANGAAIPVSVGINHGNVAGSANILDISNNIIGGITVSNSTVTGNSGHSFYGISTNHGTNTIYHNTIGSTTTSNSINLSNANSSALSAGSTQIFAGIYCTTNFLSTTVNSNTIANVVNAWNIAASGSFYSYNYGIYMSVSNVSATTLSINSNQVFNISAAMGSVSSTGNIYGIYYSCSYTANVVTIDNNTIYGLTNTNTSFAGQISGIFYAGQANASTVTRNFIHSLSVTGASSTGALIYGLYINRGSTTFANNIIRLGGNTASTLYGIYETYSAAGDAPKIYYNTIYLDGTLAAGTTNKSYALYSNFNYSSRDFRNNILCNARSTTSGSNLHYALYLNYTAPTYNGNTFVLNNNNYYASGTGGVLGYYNNANVTSLPLVTGYDANSLPFNPSFTSAGGTIAANYLPLNQNLLGAAGTGVTTDYTGAATRSASIPAIGAYEYAITVPVTVTATAGTASGNYVTLKYAFDAINAGTHQGDIDVIINSNTTEFISAVLNSSAAPSSYNRVNIYPSVTGLTISGNLAATLIDLNGADNVTIDGRLNQSGSSKDLTIINSSTSSTAGTGTIRFINDATSNIVKYCTIKGSTGYGSGGIVFFSTTTGSTGNDGNTIDNNDITNADNANRPRFSIFSTGTATKENSGITISNNNIYDLMSLTSNPAVIYLGDYNTSWTISGNSFYENAAFTPTSSGTHAVINITYTNYAGTGFDIKDNYIGGSDPLCGGASWTKNDGQNNSFTAIYLKAGTGTASSVQNNTIKKISYTNNAANATWYGIRIAGGDVNIGTVTGNTVGEITGNNSISHTISVAGGNFIYGISLESTGIINCQNNNIGSLTTSHTLNTGDGRIYPIQNIGSGSTKNISNNKIGSTDAGTTNSINASSLATAGNQYVYGIYSAASGTITIDGNVISQLTNGSNNSSTTGVTRGIDVSSGTYTVTNNTVSNITSGALNTGNSGTAGILVNNSSAVHTVSGNTIYNISNSHASYSGQVVGLSVSGTTASASTISRNFIHDLSVTGGAGSTAAIIYGFYSSYGSFTASNNIITLGGNSTTSIYGIYTPGSTAGVTENVFFNTVYVGGSLGSGATNKSYALYNAANSSTRDYRNNILFNSRSTAAGSNLHYAMYIVTANGTITSNYNDYIASGTGGTLGYYAANKTTAVIVTAQDVNSLSTNPLFAAAGGTLAADYYVSATLPAITGTGITTDYNGNARSLTPRMGVWEVNGTLAVSLLSFTGMATGNAAVLQWTTSSETDHKYFELQRSQDGISFSTITTISGLGNSSSGHLYSYTDMQPLSGGNYYRLKQIDINGRIAYSAVINITIEKGTQQCRVYPNPVTHAVLNIQLSSAAVIKIYNSTGAQVLTKLFAAGTQQLDVSKFAKGIYYLHAGTKTEIVVIQ